MKIYIVRMRVESPLICTEEQIGNVLRHSGPYLKGRALRGGFLGPVYQDHPDEIHPDEIVEESRHPQLIFHPAYPVFEGLNVEPAHSFIYSCKICEAIEEKDPYGMLGELEKGKMPEVIVCQKGHFFSIRTLGGSLIIRKRDRLERRGLEFTSVRSVGINRFLKGAEHGMLYEYVALSPGLEFRSFIVDLADRMEKFGLTQKSEIRIGRGCTRGLGRINVKIGLEEDALYKESERIRRILEKRDGTLILRALSPVCRLRGDGNLFTEPFPETGDGWLKPIELSVLNGNAAITVLEELSGFSNVGRLPTPRLVGAGVGSLFFYKADGNRWDEISKSLAEKRFTGFGPFSCSGLNILEVYDVG